MKLMEQTTVFEYKIADLTLSITLDSGVNLENVLSSFTPFKVENNSKPADIEIELSLKPHPPIESFGELLTNESVVWGDNFRFYQAKDVYYSTVFLPQSQQLWVMESSKNFKFSKIYVESATQEEISSLVSWFTMIAFGQSSLLNNVILIHSSVIAVGNQGFAFLGKSGTGKSTHSRMWIEAIPGATLLNDDNPAVRFDQGKVTIYGTPWSGKTPCYINKQVELKAFVRLTQGKQNVFEETTGVQAFIAVLPSCTAIRWNNELFSAMNDTLQLITEHVKVGYLKCLPNHQAAKLCYKKVIE